MNATESTILSLYRRILNGLRRVLSRDFISRAEVHENATLISRQCPPIGSRVLTDNCPQFQFHEMISAAGTRIGTRVTVNARVRTISFPLPRQRFLILMDAAYLFNILIGSVRNW